MGFGRFDTLPSMRVLVSSLIAAAVSVLTLHAQQTSESIDLPADASAVLQAKGDGVQIYACTDAPNGPTWLLKAPDAKLFDASGKEIGSHFAGPTWKLIDGSQVQGELIVSKPAPEANSVAWLLLRAKAGTATGSLANVEFIRRTETHGGVAIKSDCQNLRDVGKTVEIHYTANYTFYTKR